MPPLFSLYCFIRTYISAWEEMPACFLSRLSCCCNTDRAFSSSFSVSSCLFFLPGLFALERALSYASSFWGRKGRPNSDQKKRRGERKERLGRGEEERAERNIMCVLKPLRHFGDRCSSTWRRRRGRRSGFSTLSEIEWDVLKSAGPARKGKRRILKDFFPNRRTFFSPTSFDSRKMDIKGEEVGFQNTLVRIFSAMTFDILIPLDGEMIFSFSPSLSSGAFLAVKKAKRPPSWPQKHDPLLAFRPCRVSTDGKGRHRIRSDTVHKRDPNMKKEEEEKPEKNVRFFSWYAYVEREKKKERKENSGFSDYTHTFWTEKPRYISFLRSRMMIYYRVNNKYMFSLYT